MFKNNYTFSSFSVDNLQAAREFYANKLGLEVIEGGMGLNLHVYDSNPVFIYEKSNHTPATFTVLNFVVDDVDAAVDELVLKGITFERYDSLPADQDEKGILRGKVANQGPDIAWFKDPADNVIAVLSDQL
ncbi:MAG TPA: VOC family protein [Candidatus Saccharimonadales bacterium]|nr:VOC family protein [Candidatus Saccharimonadales bacterium]